MLQVREHWRPFIASGEKTQTRRPWKRPPKLGGIYECRESPKSPLIAKVRIKRLWREFLGDISEADAHAEGYPTREELITHFCETYARRRGLGMPARWWKQHLAEILNGAGRGPEVWCIEWEVVELPSTKSAQ